MTRSIYITSAEGNSGKSTIALGVLDTLSQQTSKIGVFRPIARSTSEPDYVVQLLLSHPGVKQSYENSIGVTYDEVHQDDNLALQKIIERYHEVAALCDVVVIIGSDYTDVSAPTELSYNARIAANLGASVLLVLGGRKSGAHGGRGLAESPGRTPEEMANFAEVAAEELTVEHATLLGVVVNRAAEDNLPAIIEWVAAEEALGGVPVWAIPEDKYLVAPTVRSLMENLDGEFFRGDPELLTREALAVVVAGMSMENVLTRLIEGAVVLVPADRSEVLLAVLMAHVSDTFPSISGLVLYGGFEIPPQIVRLVEGLDPSLPIIRTDLGTYDTVLRVTETRGR
ncbi:MAG: DRTGG domain-containing protein, partial [Microbacteriaceae bacterium]